MVAPDDAKTLAVFSRGMLRIPHLQELLGADRVIAHPRADQAREVDAVIGWGNKKTGDRARAYAEHHQLPFLRAEDGFLRSIHLGADRAPPLSLILDDEGVYYDARHPSHLERLLEGPNKGDDPLSNATLLERASRCRTAICQAGLSKYNNSPPSPSILDKLPKRFVLLVDQTASDSSIEGGLASAETFNAMLRAALEEYPSLPIVVKLHPEVVAGKKRGHLAGAQALSKRIIILSEALSPAELFSRTEQIYVCSSQLGFDALMAEVPVTCFGMPFYAGWGLTDDRLTQPRRMKRRSLDQLVAASLILYPRYIHPDTGMPCQIEEVVEHLARQRNYFEKNKGDWLCFGFSKWKHAFVREFLQCPGNKIYFLKTAADADRIPSYETMNIIVWGQRGKRDGETLSQKTHQSVHCMEDGLLRSIGLGSDIYAPYSLVVDTRGVYYDPHQESDLEHIISTHEFTASEKLRGKLLRQRIVDARISKYNLNSSLEQLVPKQIKASGTRKIILVPGQVEDDASIRLGCPNIRTNLQLLQAVRAEHPNDYIIYKPHPDVVSGNRQGVIQLADARAIADEIVLKASLADCLDEVDEVHTMTSLVGFEGLLRGLKVTCYGHPFYSGWGLTNDRTPLIRRKQRPSLDELVFAALVLYPRYINYETHSFTTPEFVIAELARQIKNPKQDDRAVSWRPIRQMKRLFRLIKLSMNARSH